MERKEEPPQSPAAWDRFRRCGANLRRLTVETLDDRFDYGERRVYAIGVVNGLEITVIYTDRTADENNENNENDKNDKNDENGDHQRRIISAWRSEPHERRHYWRALKDNNGGQRRLKANGSNTKRRKAKRNTATDWSRLRRRSALAIRKGIAADPDAHPTDAQFWKTAKVVLPTPKEIVTMRLDADLLRWFRQQRGYQTRINAILRAYMQAHGSA